jgi:hypothetical protein
VLVVSDTLLTVAVAVEAFTRSSAGRWPEEAVAEITRALRRWYAEAVDDE